MEPNRMEPNRMEPNRFLKKVAWCNLWNYARAMDTDGGSLIHLTQQNGPTGTTLCGRHYPADKGSPACTRLCKRCRRTAAILATRDSFALPAGWLGQLEWIESQED